MKKIAIMTSGGDSPGMNACIRSLVRVSLSKDCEPWGVFRAYDGLIDDSIKLLSRSDVSNIIHCGGTMLKTARSQRFLTQEGLKQAANHLKKRKIDTLIAIGGDGTMKGLHSFKDYWNGQIIGIPGTIDNDLYGTDETIGYDTAINTAVESIDRIRDTAGAHERNFIVEVMGRHSGHIAIAVGLAGGAEEILIPENDVSLDQIAQNMRHFSKQGKSSQILIIAEQEGESSGFDLAKKLREQYGLDYKTSVLGYIQRGGSPTVRDRLLASKLASFAIDIVQSDSVSGVMVGEIRGQLTVTSLPEILSQKKKYDTVLYELSKILR